MNPDTEMLGPEYRFKSTVWGLVFAADNAEALNALVRIYWKPLYFFVRQRGHDNESAKDIVQEFLTRLLERKALLKADPARGRFRTFLLASLKNFLVDWSRESGRQKRGGNRTIQSLDFQEGEREYALQAVSGDSPDRVLDRAWARTLFDQCLAELEGTRSHLEALRLRLSGEEYRVIAERTGLTENAAQNAVHRLSRRFGEVLRERLRPFCSTPSEFEEELSEFLTLIAR